jgi:hypothetical protein
VDGSIIAGAFANFDESVRFDEDIPLERWAERLKFKKEGPSVEGLDMKTSGLFDTGVKRRLYIHDFKFVLQRERLDVGPLRK